MILKTGNQKIFDYEFTKLKHFRLPIALIQKSEEPEGDFVYVAVFVGVNSEETTTKLVIKIEKSRFCTFESAILT